MSRQENEWAGAFGAAYVKRNMQTFDVLNARYRKMFGRTIIDLNQQMVGFLPRSTHVLEVGSNIGLQLDAMQRIGFRDTAGVEIQSAAVAAARPSLGVVLGSAVDLPFVGGEFGLVFTSGLLMHLPEEDLHRAIFEIYRVSDRWIYGLEAYSKTVVERPYLGRGGLAWSRDYVSAYANLLGDGVRRLKERRMTPKGSPFAYSLFLLEKTR